MQIKEITDKEIWESFLGKLREKDIFSVVEVGGI